MSATVAICSTKTLNDNNIIVDQLRDEIYKI